MAVRPWRKGLHFSCWSLPGRPEASDPVRDDPRVLAAPYEAAALLQGVQGSDTATNLLKYGRALRYIKLALQYHDACCSLMLAQIASNRAAYLEEYSYQTKEDQELLHSLHRERSCQTFNMASDLATDPEYELFVSNLSRGEFSQEEALYYNKVPLPHPGNSAADYAPLSRKAQEQVKWLKSLKYCDLQTESARQPLYQYRAATIHHRLASMYHSCFCNQVGDEHLRKQHRSLAELHYSKAVRLFLSLKDTPYELLLTLLERVAFTEFTMAGQSSSGAKLKTLTGALDILTETHHAFLLIHKELIEEHTES
ncbi:hypothetical protein J4Q44_G00006560 [Coregonus suidteri]|uniref:EDRF1 TPR repeats region domain-containing protein n=1 Tax=Coregonus suidteri TaxID=861788 RepID=A0AAN8MES1_9TELE